jgi:hypothetical protein
MNDVWNAADVNITICGNAANGCRKNIEGNGTGMEATGYMKRYDMIA